MNIMMRRMVNKLFAVNFTLIVLIMVHGGCVTTKNVPQAILTPAELANDFYGNFYTSYKKYMEGRNRKLGDFKKLFKTRNYFSGQLYSYLINDERHQLASKGELVGLDFDPFTYAQDDVGKPLIDKVDTFGEKALVHVTFSMYPDHHMILELTQNPKGFVISNFIYPDDHTDLLTIFTELKKSR